MRKSVILLTALMLIIVVAIVVWSINRQHASESVVYIPALPDTSMPAQAKPTATQPPLSIGGAVPSSHAESKVLQINVTDTAILERKLNDWMSARGCNPVVGAQDIGEPISTLRQQALNNNPTAASILGMHLIYDPEKDRRAEAKQVLWQAAIQGSTCALMNYYLFWQRFSLANRSIKHGLSNKPYVHYTLKIPATDAAKRQAILNAYAWDLVWEMRTGVSDIPEYSSTLESQYHYGFRWTADDRAQAC